MARAADRADLVAGIVSFNDAATVAEVADAVRQGLGRAFGSQACQVVLADGGSTDETVARAREVLPEACEVVTFANPLVDPLHAPFHGLPGRPDALRAVLDAAARLEARACVLLDAGVTSVTAAWIEQLAGPALDGRFDYVSAHFTRHAYEGALTRSLVAPMFRALYGQRLRQPAALEFGCSAGLLRHYRERTLAAGDAPPSIDLRLATAAVAGGFRVCETELGARTHARRAVAPDLSTVVGQVVGELFRDLEADAETWQRVRASAAVPVVGPPAGPRPSAPSMDVGELMEAFRLGYRALADVWGQILPPRSVLQLKKLADAPAAAFRLDDELWARLVYDFAMGHRLRVIPREHLLGALTPLYLGWLGSFVAELREDPAADDETRIERLGSTFEAQKPYLISRWRWPERLRS